MVEKISIKKFNDMQQEQSKKNVQQYIKFEQGKRKFIHPLFEDIDDLDCYFLYNKIKKFFYVEFSPVINNSHKSYTRSLISSDVSFIVKEIKNLQGMPLV